MTILDPLPLSILSLQLENMLYFDLDSAEEQLQSLNLP